MSEELAARCEQADGPNRDLDLRIAKLGNVPAGAKFGHNPEMAWVGGLGYGVPDYTASIDSALTLVPKDFLWFTTNAGVNKKEPVRGRATAFVGRWDNIADADPIEAATPALALCSAALKARQP